MRLADSAYKSSLNRTVLLSFIQTRLKSQYHARRLHLGRGRNSCASVSFPSRRTPHVWGSLRAMRAQHLHSRSLRARWGRILSRSGLLPDDQIWRIFLCGPLWKPARLSKCIQPSESLSRSLVSKILDSQPFRTGMERRCPYQNPQTASAIWRLCSSRLVRSLHNSSASCQCHLWTRFTVYESCLV